MNGPFKGLRYPELLSAGSSFFPKLLGSYECEIAPLINDLCAKPYDAVVDIGCAEGYYAVGMAMRMPRTKVYAFDLSPKALGLCRQMADFNRVSVILGRACTKETLTNLDLGQRSLIISDCEGYELQLFDADTARLLQNHDLLVETHDHVNLECSDIVMQNLSPTHRVTVFESVDDFAKPRHRQYQFKELEPLTLTERFQCLREYRGMPQKWLFAQSKAWS